MRSWTPIVSGSARLATRGRPIVREATHPANRRLLTRAAAPTMVRDGRNTASAPTTTWTMAVATNSLPRVGSPLWLPDSGRVHQAGPDGEQSRHHHRSGRSEFFHPPVFDR